MNSTQFWYSNDLVIQSCRLLHKCRGLWSRKMKKIFIWKKKIFIWNVFWRRRRDTCVNYRARQIDHCHTSHQISSSHQANCDFESLYICDNIVVPSIDNIKCANSYWRSNVDLYKLCHRVKFNRWSHVRDRRNVQWKCNVACDLELAMFCKID